MVVSRKRKVTFASGYNAKRMRTTKPKARQYATISQLVEKKIVPLGLSTRNLLLNDLRLYNPLYYVNRGVGKDQRIGNLGTNAKLHYRIHTSALCNDVVGTTICEGAIVRFIVYKHNKEWRTTASNGWDSIGGGVGVNMTSGELFYDTSAERLATSFLNQEDITVLHDKHVKVIRAVYRTTDSVFNGRSSLLSGVVNLGNLKWNAGDGSFLKDGNIYCCIVASASSPSSSVDTTVTIRTNFLVTFGDA